MRKQILVIEDNELNRAILHQILSDSYQVLEAENGQEGLEILREHKDSIALILLDVMMPLMDGYTFLDRVRDDAELSLIPVIVTTQSDGEENEIAALAHGATDFVPKPYRPQVILHRVASLIKLRETAAMVNQFQYDRLTGLYSKEYFYHKVRERLDTDTEQEFTIVCSDIENFKLYNDTFGRESGDRLLKEFALNLQKIAGRNGDICGRYGADCFLYLTERKRERLDRERFFNEDPSGRPGLNNNISYKWGIYEVTDRSLPVEQMCDRALLAAKSVKGKYDHPFAVYDDALRGRLLREKAITDAMETALTEGQFVVYYQPKYSLSGNCMAGAEALVRWMHPEWGFISPGEFIPLFEKNGFIPRLDQYVWERVCAQLRAWKDRGWQLLPVSVNVSRADVYQNRLVDTLRGLTQKYGIHPQYLHLEITESAYAETPDQIIRTVAELRSLGFVVEMDDFGSGYSSLNMLSQMTLDILKLDMKFIQNEITKPESQSILRDVVSMAHRMHLSVVAEGVETQEQVHRLRAVDCDYVQGYYFAKPMPVAEFEELLQTQNSRISTCAEEWLRPGISIQSMLVADEDAAFRQRVKQTFADRYRILEAADGKDALNHINNNDSSEIVALILSATLPEHGADEIYKALRQNPTLWTLPVLMTIPTGEMAGKLPLVQKADDFLCKCHPLFDLERRVQWLIDVASLRRREVILQDAANRDQLTGLLNRRGLQAAMSALRREDFPLAVYLFDLDNLKTVNDTSGHQTGDQVISAFADLLRRSTRSGDILCRYGGDEFFVILKHLKDINTIIKKGEDVRRSFQNCFAEESCNASCSVGITLCGMDEMPFAAVIERADQALYRAKKEHKGNYCLWKEE